MKGGHLNGLEHYSHAACCRPSLSPANSDGEGQRFRTFKLSVYPSASNARRKAAQPHPESRGNPWAAFVSGFLADLWRAGRITLATVRNKRYSLPVAANPLIILLENRS